jgi:flagellar protein FlaG
LTQLVRALSEQGATATSPPVVALERGVAARASASTTQHPVQSTSVVQPTQPAAAPDLGIDALKAVAQQIESYLKANGRDLRFSVDQDTGRTVVTVRNSSTGEVIRQIPDAEALRIAQSLGNQPNALIDVSI